MSGWGVGDLVVALGAMVMMGNGAYRIAFADRIDAARLSRQTDSAVRHGYDGTKSPMDARMSGIVLLVFGVILVAMRFF